MKNKNLILFFAITILISLTSQSAFSNEQWPMGPEGWPPKWAALTSKGYPYRAASIENKPENMQKFRGMPKPGATACTFIPKHTGEQIAEMAERVDFPKEKYGMWEIKFNNRSQPYDCEWTVRLLVPSGHSDAPMITTMYIMRILDKDGSFSNPTPATGPLIVWPPSK
jgi:hypothetical protein